MTTFEDARRCPKCEEPGKQVETRALARGEGTVHTFQCENGRCKWNGTRWTVQTRPDGTIPEAHRGPKKYPELNHHSRAAQVARDLQRQMELETQTGGAEMRNPYS